MINPETDRVLITGATGAVGLATRSAAGTAPVASATGKSTISIFFAGRLEQSGLVANPGRVKRTR